MRHLFSLPLVGLAAVLSGCGGHSNSNTTGIIPLTYSIGGSIAGLAGTIVLQNNSVDTLSLSSDGTFTFDVALQPNSPYDVTIVTQPANQVCTISNPNGTASASVTNIAIVCSLSSTASDVWTWVAGANYVNAPGIYGTQGTAVANGTPGARKQAVAWTDAAGNFWLFGGNSAGNVAMLNDLWEYTLSSTGPSAAGQWVWQGGSDTVGAAASYGSLGTPAAGNNPGAREGAAQWTDAAGNLWLFGGDTLAGQNSAELNDLWSYNPTSGLWTWVGGSNTTGNMGNYGAVGVAAAGNLPPARTDALSWVDSAGTFWLFGGLQLNTNGSYLAVLNDLWSYSPTSGLWTWVGGSSTPDAQGVYGAQGTPGTNVPAARMGSSTWMDATGNLWLFGGLGLSSGGVAQEYGDLWSYSPTSGLWTWVGGSSVPNAAGIYGTQHAGTAGNGPGARVSPVSWTDPSGNFWLFGGYGYAEAGYVGDLNDLWEYQVGTGVWTWISGSSSTAASATYGTQGVAAGNNVPGAREQSAGWLDHSGNFWLFGGLGFDASDAQGDLNDLWRFTQSP
jgi:hypothetical protein